MGTQPPQKGEGPQLSAHVYCGQTARWINFPLDTELGLCPGHTVLDSDPDPLKGVQPPQFLAHVRCGQTAWWMKMLLDREIDLGPGYIALDGDAAPPQRDTAPQFSAHVNCGQMAGWIKMPLGTKVGLGPGHIVLHEHLFLFMCILIYFYESCFTYFVSEKLNKYPF